MNIDSKVQEGDCLGLLQQLSDESVDLIYMDPPFFTDKAQSLKTRDRTREFSYDDLWKCSDEYAEFFFYRLVEMKRVLKSTGNIFVHCDKNATHIIRALLDNVFGEDNFQSEIIWSYKRWSNAKKGLLSSHQTIYFYSKSKQHKFNTIYNDYSESTNVDQILQKRARDEYGKAVYARNEDEIVLDDEKKGVPLGDVWDIPYLNPKAKERVGYPTQKPILLLERIIKISTDPEDVVLDPFCGSGTTLVAAKLAGRNSIGMDTSKEAVELTKARLAEPIRSKSRLVESGRSSYLNADTESLNLLHGLDVVPVQRNKGIDAILRRQYEGTPVLIRVQKRGESLTEAANLLSNAAKRKGALKSILIRTEQNASLFSVENVPENILVTDSTAFAIDKLLSNEPTISQHNSG